MRRSAATVALTLIVAIGVASPASAQDDLRGFCRARVALEQARLSDDDFSTDEAVDEVADRAPAAVADAARDLAELLPHNDFRDGEVQRAKQAVDAFVFANCDLRTTTISSVDYGFQGVPQLLDPGTVMVQFANTSRDHEHELLVLWLPSDDHIRARQLLSLPMDEILGHARVVGSAFAKPGDTDFTIMDLEPGRYVVACRMPNPDDDASRVLPDDNDGAKPHWRREELAEFRVES